MSDIKEAVEKIPLSASTSGDYIAPDYIKGWNNAIDAIDAASKQPERVTVEQALKFMTDKEVKWLLDNFPNGLLIVEGK